jgi:hypothetical protein
MKAFTSAFPGLNFWGRLLFLTLTFLCLSACDIIENDDYNPPIIPPIGGMPAPYQDVSISPDGQKLIFFRTKYTYVSKNGLNIEYDPDSTGIWICNIDGSEMKFIYKNHWDFIGRPQFIPNSNHILFNLNLQIVKAPYNGRLIDDQEIEFLTTEGKNFFPSVDDEGEFIVFDSNINDPNSSYNIWSMEISGNNKMQIIGGRMPHLRKKNIFYVGLYYEIYSYDLATRVNKKETSFNLFYNDGIKLPIINDEETKFIFLANGKLGVFNLITNIYAIMNETIAQNAVWYGNNKIILVILTGYKLNNGTIWIMNEDGSDKRQITHNYGLVLEGGE